MALVAFGEAPTATLLAVGTMLLVGTNLWRLVNESNAELTRFVTALERADFSQSFRREGRGAGFEQLGSGYEHALDRLRGERATGARTARFAETLIDSAPTPLLVLGPGDEMRFANKAARRLFGRSEPCAIGQLARFGLPFVTTLRTLAPGMTTMAHIVLDGLSQRVALDATAMDSATGHRRIIALKVIQVELDSAELAAQVDLVRVLTHEVMNSLTPVTSLAASALRLIDALDAGTAPGIGDAQVAIAALARRATELERFVDSYKGFSDAPTLDYGDIELGRWFNDLASLFAATTIAAGIDVRWHAAESLDTFEGDVGLLTQVMLNLLKNAGEALADTIRPAISVSAVPLEDHRVRITIADNGPGIAPVLAQDIFLPFFTTKPSGTGIGLSFARKVILLHGGLIGLCGEDQGCFEIILPFSRRAPPL